MFLSVLIICCWHQLQSSDLFLTKNLFVLFRVVCEVENWAGDDVFVCHNATKSLV